MRAIVALLFLLSALSSSGQDISGLVDALAGRSPARSAPEENPLLVEERAPITTQQGALSAVMDSFLAAHASDTAEWRRDIQIVGNANAPLPAGRLRGYSTAAGWFTFRAAKWHELTVPQRERLRKDPRLLQFLRMLRKTADGAVLYPEIPAEFTQKPKPPAPAKVGAAELFHRLTTPSPYTPSFIVDLTPAQILDLTPIHVFLAKDPAAPVEPPPALP